MAHRSRDGVDTSTGGRSRFLEVLAEEADFSTTSLVLVECANAAARRPYRAAVVELRESLTAAGAAIDPSGTEWEQAWQNYARGNAGSASVVDQLSFLIMRRYGVIPFLEINCRHTE